MLTTNAILMLKELRDDEGRLIPKQRWNMDTKRKAEDLLIAMKPETNALASFKDDSIIFMPPKEWFPTYPL